MKLTLAATLDSVTTVTEKTDELLEEAGFSPKAQMQIDIAIDEIVSNICYYAYDGDGEFTFEIEIDPDPLCARLVFSDGGKEFDPLAMREPDTDSSADQRKKGGLGIFIVKKTMDEVSYRYENSRNILTIRKLSV